MLPTYDPVTVAEKVVTERLTQVASQLSKVNTDSEEAADAQLEAELMDDTPMVTPSVSPKEAGTPAEPVSVAPAGKVDQLDQRVIQIFGKKRTIDDDGHAASPKVANIDAVPIVGNNGTGENNGVTNIAANGIASSGSGSKNNVINIADVTNPTVTKGSDIPDVQPGIDHNAAQEVGDDGMDVGDHFEEANDDGAEDDEWIEAEEEPEAYPEGAFPMQVPGYPMQPIFQYRYRTPNSTPRSRRIDFKNSIVMRNCTRDPHTNRVSQEDYEAREDSEMSLSLGYVTLIS